MTRLLAFALIVLAACASAPRADDTESIDLTGADVAKWDSLSRTYAIGPVLLELPLPLMPVPDVMRKTRITAVCTVNERGKLIRLSMTPPRDRDYGRRLARAWQSALRFHPATTREGVPTKGYYRLDYDL